MNFENVVQPDENTVTFTLTPVHVAYANTLRRLVMTGVETIAFRADMKNGTTSDVVVKTNDTPMTNEMLAHRIGLLPIHIETPLAFNPDNYVFTLKAAANKDSIRDVTCKDFVIEEPADEGKEPIVHEWDTFFPPHPITRDTCLIATLPPGDAKIHLIAKPSLGTGRENARFQPTSRCSYTYTLNTDVAAREAHFTAWMRDAKKQDLASLEDEKRKMYEREFSTMEIAKVYLKDAKGEPYSYDFVIESTGPLRVPYMVRRACDVGESMMGKYMNVDTAELEGDDFVVVPSDSRVIGFDFLLKGHDHTFGNMIQTYLEQNHIDVAEGSQIVKITYAGYAVPHPLRDELVVRIGVDSRGAALKAFAQACKGCVEIFRSIRTAWIKKFPAEAEAARLAVRLAEKVAAIRAEGQAEANAVGATLAEKAAALGAEAKAEANAVGATLAKKAAEVGAEAKAEANTVGAILAERAAEVGAKAKEANTVGAILAERAAALGADAKPKKLLRKKP
jgi:DNA-directed RNA polymerase subunit L/DNA-directed RNA polymerase alpha subunit